MWTSPMTVQWRARIQRVLLREQLSVAAGSGVLANDISGADGYATTTLIGVAAGSDTSSAVSGGVGSGVAGTYGTLTLSADGSYTYVATCGCSHKGMKPMYLSTR